MKVENARHQWCSSRKKDCIERAINAIGRDEIQTAIKKTKDGKATRVDEIRNVSFLLLRQLIEVVRLSHHCIKYSRVQYYWKSEKRV